MAAWSCWEQKKSTADAGQGEAGSDMSVARVDTDRADTKMPIA